jgi:hypothetical protein
MSLDSEAVEPRSRFYVRIPKTIAGKVAGLVRLLVLAVAGLAALVAALIAMDAAMLGDSKRRH